MTEAISTVMIVDDERLNVNVLSEILGEDYELKIALSGEQALKRALADPRPDIILLDIDMPGMDGYQVIEKLKQDPATRDIPVIFITALTTEEDEQKGLALGAVDYIHKPFHPSIILARVKNQLLIASQTQRLREQNTALAQEVERRRQAEQAVQQAHARLEELMLNTLPESIVRELQASGQVQPVQFEDASFLFSDIVGFTRLSAEKPPAVVVDWLNGIFSAFDALVEKHGLEKIRTLGDGYFVAGGLPEPRADHLHAIAALALDMQHAVTHFRSPDGDPVQLRIGLNCGGPVVAAVIGTHKFAYDIWGDTVNMASRMETHGEAGRIQVTAAVQQRLQNAFEFDARGMITLKGGVEQKTYWLRRRIR